MDYSGHKIPPNIDKIFNDCRNDIINNFRCAYCNSDAIKLETCFKAPVGASYEEKQEILKNLVLSHYDPHKKKFMPSEDLMPLCMIHAVKRGNEVKNRLADYTVFLGDTDLK